MDGFDCRARNCCRVLGNTVSKNRSRGKISMKFPCLEEHAKAEMLGMAAMEAGECGDFRQVVDEHRQLLGIYKPFRTKPSCCRETAKQEQNWEHHCSKKTTNNA